VVTEPDMWANLWPFIVPQSRLPVRADWVNTLHGHCLEGLRKTMKNFSHRVDCGQVSNWIPPEQE